MIEFGPAFITYNAAGRKVFNGLPLDGMISSEWGPRASITDPDTGAKTPPYHNGIDIQKAQGHSILAPADGVVDLVAYNPLGGGHWIRLRHDQHDPHGRFSVYLHMMSPPNKRGRLWQRGDEVKRGDELGQVGSTGLSTGPHLHWGIWTSSGASVDPLKMITDSVQGDGPIDVTVGEREILAVMGQADAEVHFVNGLFEVLGHRSLYEERDGWKRMVIEWR